MQSKDVKNRKKLIYNEDSISVISVDIILNRNINMITKNKRSQNNMILEGIYFFVFSRAVLWYIF